MKSLVPWGGRTLLPAAGRFTNAITRMEEEMEELMNRFYDMEEGWLAPAVAFVPRANVVEKENEFEVTVELPGLKPEEVKVEFKNGSLWIAGEKAEEKKEEGKTFHRVECRYGAFRRVLTLPTSVNEEKIEAHFENGILKVLLPKVEEAKPKQIEVKVN